MRATQRAALAAVVLLTLVTLPVGAASAQECTVDSMDRDELLAAYNENVDEVPGFLRGQLSDQRIDLRVETADGERQFAVTTDADGRITEFEEGAAADPSLRVETDEATLCAITTSDDPVATLRDAYGNGEIDISGVGVVNSVKVGVVKVVGSAAEFVSGLV